MEFPKMSDDNEQFLFRVNAAVKKAEVFVHEQVLPQHPPKRELIYVQTTCHLHSAEKSHFEVSFVCGFYMHYVEVVVTKDCVATVESNVSV